MIAEQDSVKRRFVMACSAFYKMRERWPVSVAELERFWDFAPSDAYTPIWEMFEGVPMTVLPNGSLSVRQEEKSIKMQIRKPKIRNTHL